MVRIASSILGLKNVTSYQIKQKIFRKTSSGVAPSGRKVVLPEYSGQPTERFAKDWPGFRTFNGLELALRSFLERVIAMIRSLLRLRRIKKVEPWGVIVCLDAAFP